MASLPTSPETFSDQHPRSSTPSSHNWSSDAESSTTCSDAENSTACSDDNDCPPFTGGLSSTSQETSQEDEGVLTQGQESYSLGPSMNQWGSDVESSATSSVGADSPALRRVASEDSLKVDGEGSRSDCGEEKSPSSPRDSKGGSEDKHGSPKPVSDVDLEKGHIGSQFDGFNNEPCNQCRVCHLSVQGSDTSESAIELGCKCKNGLAIAHRHCAEAWFKVKGDRICEICGAIAQNVAGVEDAHFLDYWNGLDSNISISNPPERCWGNQSLFNSVLICLIFALILLWLLRVTLF